MASAYRDRIETVSSAQSRDSRNTERHPCAPQTVPRAGLCGKQSTAWELRGNQRSLNWFLGPPGDDNHRRQHRGAPPGGEIPSSSDQSALAPSTLRWCGRLRNRAAFRLLAWLPYAPGILPYEDRGGRLYTSDPQIGISRGLRSRQIPACGNPHRR